MLRNLIAGVVLALALCTEWASAQSTEFSYDGRVRSGGVPFDGNGLFKFALVNNAGTLCYWSNDGVTLTGNEPTSSVLIAVSNGFFNVIVGDTTISGMAPIDPSIFNSVDRIRLRVWFNDGQHGFQQLTPDRPVSNPALIGLQTGPTTTTLYVNPSTGNDINSGLSPAKSKQTLQSAWDALPSLLRHNVVIKLTTGTYRQSATLTGKMFAGGHITIDGNSATPSLVRFTGTTIADPNANSIAQGIFVTDQHNVILQGISFDHYSNACVYMTIDAALEVDNCLFQQFPFDGIALGHSTLTVHDSQFINGLPGATTGIKAHTADYTTVYTSSFQNINVGIVASRDTELACVGNTFNTIGAVGINCDNGVNLDFLSPNTHFTNMPTGISVQYNSIVTYGTTYGVFSGVTNSILTSNGSYSR